VTPGSRLLVAAISNQKMAPANNARVKIAMLPTLPWKIAYGRARRPKQQLRPAANVLVRSKGKRCSGNKVIEVAFLRCRIFKLNVAPLRTPAG